MKSTLVRAAMAITFLAPAMAVAGAPPAPLTPIDCFTPLASPQLWKPVQAPTLDTAFFRQLPPGFAMPTDHLSRHLMREYGAILVSRGADVRPVTVLFADEAAVTAWQATVPMKTAIVGGIAVTLQSRAMEALQAAIKEASAAKLAITPAGADAARRNYARTIINWKSRVDGGLAHWRAAKKLDQAKVDAITRLSPAAQIPRILALEEQGLCFATLRDKTILRSVAAPGSSQHVFMLALDVKQHADPRVRAILARHGWFQTVVTDAPHFTYLGTDSASVSLLGLKRVTAAKRDYWVPDIN
ncbi:hypothetical protein [Sphingobium boeckii]|uniref:Uncharacterized protein n=1 Tax=Sphingobium boeckii TaxID=1082345 RepID=A0A7W9AK13_9SPHN|nr:hypothetical protein [Sphingobium boeckii]MBB5686844.1 hypothetical protein [Sphingobium boeckii]